MQLYKKAALSLAFLTLIFSAGLAGEYVNGVLAEYGQNPLSVSAKADEERRGTALMDAFEAGDYERWRRLIGEKRRISRLLTKVDFQRFVEAREAARSGDYARAVELSDKLKAELAAKRQV